MALYTLSQSELDSHTLVFLKHFIHFVKWEDVSKGKKASFACFSLINNHHQSKSAQHLLVVSETLGIAGMHIIKAAITHKQWGERAEY